MLYESKNELELEQYKQMLEGRYGYPIHLNLS